jgi:hypothetical protein
LNPLKKRKNIFAKPIDKTQGGWYNTKEKEVEQAVLTLPYMTRMGRYRKFLWENLDSFAVCSFGKPVLPGRYFFVGGTRLLAQKSY